MQNAGKQTSAALNLTADGLGLKVTSPGDDYDMWLASFQTLQAWRQAAKVLRSRHTGCAVNGVEK